MNKFSNIAATAAVLYVSIFLSAHAAEPTQPELKVSSEGSKVAIEEAGACKIKTAADGIKATVCESQCKQSFDAKDGKLKISC